MIRLLSCLVGIALLCACDNEIDPTADFVDTPIIYGLLDRTEATQYIRVERAFLEEGADATETAQDPNQLYYNESVGIFLDELNGNEVTSTASFERINGVDEGILRDPGVFVTDPNILYKLSTADFPLNPNRTYQLRVERPELETVSSRTSIVGDMILSQPPPLLTNRNIRIVPGNRPLTIALRDVPANAAVFDFVLDIGIRETSPDGIEDVQLTWRAATGVRRDELENGAVEIDPIGFYNFLSSNLEQNDLVSRRFIGIDVRIDAASSAFSQFLDILQANSGITGAEDVPVFTNIEGGKGVFASRNTLIEANFAPSNITLDSVRANVLTAPLNFGF